MPHDAAQNRRSPIVVMGVSGAGKSTVAAALAQRLNVAFADADDFHPAANIAKMRAGTPLDDTDRLPWLDRIGAWLDRHSDGGVMACSALKRSYRDRLRQHCPGVTFLHLTGSPQLIARRQAARQDHFMPPALLQSQFDTLEPLEADESGVAVDVGPGVAAIIDGYLAGTGRPGAVSP